MIKILFMRSANSYLPEIDAYIKYFNNTKDFLAYDSRKVDYKEYGNFDVIWRFKGFKDSKIKDKILVHEYASLSTGKFPKVKNLLKSVFNEKPDLRVFLNSEVKNGFYFNDSLDFCYRDMGIDENFLLNNDSKKDYEFIYVGAISKQRKIGVLLEEFKRKQNCNICLVGKVEDEIFNEYKSSKNINFIGPIEHKDVPKILSKAIYGINYIPNEYPYNLQTSTKLLEYLASGLKVLTTSYNWVNNFESENDCRFYKLDSNNIQIDIREIEKFNYSANVNFEKYLWDNIIRNSNIEEKLKMIIKNGK